MTTTTLVGHPVHKSPAYRYIRTTDKLPSIAETLKRDDPLCKVKLFNPSGLGTWYIAAYDHKTGIAYGVADILECEAGDFYMPELVALRCPPFGLAIERDFGWKPKYMSTLLKEKRW